MEYSNCTPLSLEFAAEDAAKDVTGEVIGHITEDISESFEQNTSKDLEHEPWVTEVSPVNITEKKSSNSDYVTLTLLSLLAYLRSIKEFELYYYMFNQVNIVKIEDNKVEVARTGAEKGLNTRLAEILFTWTGLKWNVIITDAPDSTSLKEKMKTKFMESEEWNMLKSHFKGQATLTDIILD